MDAIADSMLRLLQKYRNRLTTQEYKTLRGQIFAGDADGALRGLKKTLERKARAHDPQTRQNPGHSDRQQPKNKDVEE